MELAIDGRTYSGQAIDLRYRSVDPEALVAAIRGEQSPYEVACPDPGPLHHRVGVVTPETSVRPRTALAVAARSRGLSAPQDDRIEALRAERDDVEIPTVPAAPDAPPAKDVTRLRERVAALRGEVQALESAGRDPTEARDRLREAAGRLAELETERAARQQAGERLRAVRDVRERRLGIEDALANAERDARAHLVADLRGEFETALADLLDGVESSDADDRSEPDDPFDAPADATALAVLRVGEVAAPVVLGVDRFASPAAAAAWIEAPVIRL